MSVEIEVEFEEERFKGILIKEDKNYMTIKLPSGYNANVSKKDSKIISKKEIKETKENYGEVKKQKIESNNLPKIVILHTGGTIASKVDYETGAVSSKFTPDELLALYPELNEVANIDAKMIGNVFSGDLNINHWNLFLEYISKEVSNPECRGIILTHGTDTIQYTAPALQFALKNLPMPVIIVGAQRSSDRPSSDAYSNLYAAINFIINNSSNDLSYRRVGLCMHNSTEDDSSFVILDSISLKKMHSSRRDTFKQINFEPFAIIKNGKCSIQREELLSREPRDKFLCVKYNPKIKLGFFKSHPNLFSKEISDLNKYDAVVIEGTGLGHMAVQKIDEFTNENEENLKELEKLVKKTKVIMGTQCVYGGVNMNVYSYGRKIKEKNVLGQGMNLVTETLFARAAYCLSQKEKSFEDCWSENLEGFELRTIDIIEEN